MNSKQIKTIQKVYEQGGNLIKYLKENEGRDENKIEDILISYDFQAGTYTDLYYKNKKNWNSLFEERANILKDYIESLSGRKEITVLEGGIGEATACYGFLSQIQAFNLHIYGFDISWSRLKYAKKFLEENKFQHESTLFIADLKNIPLGESTMDIVYTNHAIEPNGGKEEEILDELYRVAKHYIILFEPDDGMANEDAKKRMKENGYISNLYSIVKKKWGNQVELYAKLNYLYNVLNPASVIVIHKNCGEDKKSKPIDSYFADPVTHDRLDKYNDECFYSKSSLSMYPIMQGIPCLLEENAILATKYMDFLN